MANKKHFVVFSEDSVPSDFNRFKAKWSDIGSSKEIRNLFLQTGKDRIAIELRQILFDCLSKYGCHPNRDAINVTFHANPYVFASACAHLLAKQTDKNVHYMLNNLKCQTSIISYAISKGSNSTPALNMIFDPAKAVVLQSGQLYKIGESSPLCFWRMSEECQTMQALADCVHETTDERFDYINAQKIFSFRKRLSPWLACVDAICFADDYNILVMEPPVEIHFNRRRQLDNKNGPAAVYPEVKIYAVDGVSLDREWIESNPDDITIEKIFSITNAEQRKAVISRITTEVFNRKLAACPEAKVIDRAPNGYELLSIKMFADVSGRVSFGDRTEQQLIEEHPSRGFVFTNGMVDGRYLKMVNPSTGAIHVEGVASSCYTVQDAINWRTGGLLKEGNWKPVIVT